jgi:hypothetical protein
VSFVCLLIFSSRALRGVSDTCLCGYEPAQNARDSGRVLADTYLLRLDGFVPCNGVQTRVKLKSLDWNPERAGELYWKLRRGIPVGDCATGVTQANAGVRENVQSSSYEPQCEVVPLLVDHCWNPDPPALLVGRRSPLSGFPSVSLLLLSLCGGGMLGVQRLRDSSLCGRTPCGGQNPSLAHSLAGFAFPHQAPRRARQDEKQTSMSITRFFSFMQYPPRKTPSSPRFHPQAPDSSA